jgi:hypothetical protein
MGWRCGGSDRGRQEIGLAEGAWTLSKAFFGSIGSQGSAADVPCHVSGLVGLGDRKSIQPMAERLAPSDYDQLHHFIANRVWDAGRLERELLVQADGLVRGSRCGAGAG